MAGIIGALLALVLIGGDYIAWCKERYAILQPSSSLIRHQHLSVACLGNGADHVGETCLPDSLRVSRLVVDATINERLNRLEVLWSQVPLNVRKRQEHHHRQLRFCTWKNRLALASWPRANSIAELIHNSFHIELLRPQKRYLGVKSYVRRGRLPQIFRFTQDPKVEAVDPCLRSTAIPMRSDSAVGRQPRPSLSGELVTGGLVSGQLRIQGPGDEIYAESRQHQPSGADPEKRKSPARHLLLGLQIILGITIAVFGLRCLIAAEEALRAGDAGAVGVPFVALCVLVGGCAIAVFGVLSFFT